MRAEVVEYHPERITDEEVIDLLARYLHQETCVHDCQRPLPLFEEWAKDMLAFAIGDSS